MRSVEGKRKRIKHSGILGRRGDEGQSKDLIEANSPPISDAFSSLLVAILDIPVKGLRIELHLEEYFRSDKVSN